jgi:hypothetical protein
LPAGAGTTVPDGVEVDPISGVADTIGVSVGATVGDGVTVGDKNNVNVGDMLGSSVGITNSVGSASCPPPPKDKHPSKIITFASTNPLANILVRRVLFFTATALRY